tara:strand:- start:4920 stop:5399 length:480 start_codon:yes stop_codon:yes gene_type:complete
MSEKSYITKEMNDHIGVETTLGSVEIEKGAIIKFAQAIGDENPLFQEESIAKESYTNGIIAPPTFLRSIDAACALTNTESKVDIIPEYFNARVDGGSEWEYFGHIRPGDTITVSKMIQNLFERSGRMGEMLFVVSLIKYVNQLDELIATQTTTGICYRA